MLVLCVTLANHRENSEMDKKIIVTALIATGFGTAALAQDEGAAPAPAPAPQEELGVLPVFDTVDTNRDGMIDATEGEMITEALEEEHQIAFQFETADRNSDGLLNSEEYVAYDAMLKERLGIA